MRALKAAGKVALWAVQAVAAAAFIPIGIAKFAGPVWVRNFEARRLDPARFARIHRSTIVNVVKVAELRPAFHGEFDVVLASGRRWRCSRTSAANLTRMMQA